MHRFPDRELHANGKRRPVGALTNAQKSAPTRMFCRTGWTTGWTAGWTGADRVSPHPSPPGAAGGEIAR
ncbi:hypothetical protein I549_3542 [Mycobacterium avium subsp. avium 2285 (R)]|uniref:Uncharacterized protein n=1 Tax=Mycobacterium avium (strain 104) TaxID=243243 RepID=A0A0H2ZW63_MYCA1|nr:hypothetical protein MAV_2815 [Mycobacterium avium 104]EUA40413.1 hypothetical protein I549_3542 [Mycobacterium avium subsp. avium 2285 (R)]